MQGFNAMLAVQSIEAAKLYYEELQRQQAALPEAKRLKVATIFSFAPNEEQSAYGEIQDEELDPQDTAMPLSSKEFLSRAIDDYNHMFNDNSPADGNEFKITIVTFPNELNPRKWIC